MFEKRTGQSKKVLVVTLVVALTLCPVLLCGSSHEQHAHADLGHANMAVAGCVSNALGIASSLDTPDPIQGAGLSQFFVFLLSLGLWAGFLNQEPPLAFIRNGQSPFTKPSAKLYKLHSVFLI